MSWSLRIPAFNCKICLALEELEVLVTAKMLPFSRPAQRIVGPHRWFHRILPSVLRNSSLVPLEFLVGHAWVSGQDFRSQASALWTVGTEFSAHSSLAQVSAWQGRPAFAVPSFVRTFALPNPSLMSSCAITASQVASQACLAINSVLTSTSAPILHQPFVFFYRGLHWFPQEGLNGGVHLSVVG